MRHNGEGMGRSRAGALFPSVKKQQRKWRCEEVDKDNGGLVQFLALLEIFQMILGNLKSQTPTGWKRPPKVCSSTSCTRQVQLDQVVGKFSVSPRMEIPQTIWAPVPVFDHPHVIFFFLSQVRIYHVPTCVCYLSSYQYAPQKRLAPMCLHLLNR